MAKTSALSWKSGQRKSDNDMRSYFFSIIGHIVIFAGIAFASLIEPRQFDRLVVIPVKTVSTQAVQQLIEQNTNDSQPKPKVMQVRPEPDKPLPDKRWRERQTVKNESQQQSEAPKTQETASTGEQSTLVPGMRVDADFDYPDYLITIRDKISTYWRPPRMAATLKTTVYFKITRDGKLLRTFVENRSAVMSFDLSAMNAVMKSAPFPPFPEGFKGEDLGIHLEFIFEP